ncbi:hypothetical protein PEC302107_13430 [Pectobacterium araliae]|uniref:hypothetical protein n=1 Tax=Pectobacterium araliae TaxID=3073862 RepID=UPI00208A61C5|nr:hypothetical protein PEC302107_13430 [Pectobacterium carotovorum subsp. carotovorum]
MSNGLRIYYKIEVKAKNNQYGDAESRIYTLFFNDPSGEITRTINEKRGGEFVADLICEKRTPSGMLSGDGQCRVYSIDVNIHEGENIRSVISTLAIENDEYLRDLRCEPREIYLSRLNELAKKEFTSSVRKNRP